MTGVGFKKAILKVLRNNLPYILIVVPNPNYYVDECALLNESQRMDLSVFNTYAFEFNDKLPSNL